MQKKHGLLEADVISRQDRIDGIVKASENFCQAGHFDADTIKAKQEQVVHRYKTLTVSMSSVSIASVQFVNKITKQSGLTIYSTCRIQC